MIKVTVKLIQARGRKQIGSTQTLEAQTWQVVMLTVANWLRIEVLPYWETRDLIMSFASDDKEVIAALHGIAVAWGIRVFEQVEL